MSDRVFNLLRILLFAFLAVWGIYTILVYLDVGVHQSVLLSEAGRQMVAAACPGGGVICRGVAAFYPFIDQTIAWASPFMWYGIWSLIAFGIVLGIGYLQTGRWEVKLRLSPLIIFLCFIASLWLTFTVIATGTNSDDMPFSRLFEPTPEVYSGIDAEGMKVLQENYQNLLDRGCLIEIGETQVGAKVYDVKQMCMQTAFFTRVLSQVLMVFGLLFVFLTLGRALLHLLRKKNWQPIVEAIFSVGLGACGMVVILWLLALIGSIIDQPIYSQVAGWAILLLIPALLYHHALYWLRTFVMHQWKYEGMAYTGALILGWLLISYFALNFINVVRPFPIGWDDLGKYINQPRLLVSYGMAIPPLASFLWEYITSLGFLLFGFESVFGATAAMIFNWSAGLLATLSVYVFGRLYLGRNQGLLAALLYYAMPVVGHFSYADMKVDNAVFFMGSLSVLAMFLGLFPTAEDAEEHHHHSERVIDWRWMVLAGVLGGFAFAMKATAVMTLMALGAVLLGATVHWSAFVGAMSLAWMLFTRDGRFNLADIGMRVYGDPEVFSRSMFVGAFFVLGIALLGYSWWIRPKAFKKTSIAAGIFVGSFIVAIAPWVLSNNIAHGNIVPRLLFTSPNRFTASMIISGSGSGVSNFGEPVSVLPAELRIDQSLCVSTAKTEELDRYWGYHSGWGHFFTLPWRSVMNIDSAGYYVTTYPALLLFPLLLLLPFFWMKQARWLRWLFVGTLFMLFQWMFFANGILWYGLGMFFGIVIGLEVLVFRAPDLVSKTAASILIGISLLTCFAQRFWQYDQQKNLFEYAIGKISYEAIRERTIPNYDDIREMIEVRAETMPDRPYVYRVGTFIPYFIPKNLEVFPVADHQLDFFNCLHQEKDPALTLKRLQALGFNAIIFDTNTATIERDQNGSLHQKVQSFVDFVNTPGMGFQIPVQNPENGVAFILLP